METFFLQARSDELMNLLHSQLKPKCRIEFNTVPAKNRPFGVVRNIHDSGGQYVSILGRDPLLHHPHHRWPHAVYLQKTERLTQGLTQVAKRLADEAWRRPAPTFLPWSLPQSRYAYSAPHPRIRVGRAERACRNKSAIQPRMRSAGRNLS
jgi:hypothetical protein